MLLFYFESLSRWTDELQQRLCWGCLGCKHSSSLINSACQSRTKTTDQCGLCNSNLRHCDLRDLLNWSLRFVLESAKGEGGGRDEKKDCVTSAAVKKQIMFSHTKCQRVTQHNKALLEPLLLQLRWRFITPPPKPKIKRTVYLILKHVRFCVVFFPLFWFCLFLNINVTNFFFPVCYRSH